MAWADKGSDRLLVNLALLKADALILLLHRRCCADLTIPLPDAHRDVRDLPSTFLAPLDAPAEVLEGFNEEALNMVRLQAQRQARLLQAPWSRAPRAARRWAHQSSRLRPPPR